MIQQSPKKVALITGGAKRIGAAIATHLHQQGINVIIHYRHSKQAATDLSADLNQARANSASIIAADLNTVTQQPDFLSQAIQPWGRLDYLINNASSFYPTNIGTVDAAAWDDLFNSNLKGAFFLSQQAVPYLQQTQGAIINITDTHADKPLKNHSVYCMAKAGLQMMTKTLARDLAPTIRVNAVAPGAILWPEGENVLEEKVQQKIMQCTALQRHGAPEDIAQAVYFLLAQTYVTGETLRVDGGRS